MYFHPKIQQSSLSFSTISFRACIHLHVCTLVWETNYLELVQLEKGDCFSGYGSLRAPEAGVQQGLRKVLKLLYSECLLPHSSSFCRQTFPSHFSPQAFMSSRQKSKQNDLVCSVSLFLSPPLCLPSFPLHPHHCICPPMR